MNTLKITHRIGLGYLVITLAFLLLSGITALQMQTVSRSAARMENEAELLHLADTWKADVRQNSARSLAVAYSEGSAMLEFFQAAMKETTAPLPRPRRPSWRWRKANRRNARRMW